MIGAIPHGSRQGREFGEAEWAIDVAFAVVWILFFALNFFMTLARRRVTHLYVSLWFYIASIVTIGLVQVIGSAAVPIELAKSDPLLAGVQDALLQWWYGHNLYAFLVIMPFLGVMYYFLPKASGQAVYSYKLSILHFWSLVLLYVWKGPHHLHYAPIPDWVGSLAVVGGLMLWMPSWGGMINGLFTLRGAREKVTKDPVLKFMFVALICYGITTFGEMLLSLKGVGAMAQYSDWTIAHVHLGAMGWNAMLTFAVLYWLSPKLFGRPLWSPLAVSVHFWVAALGLAVYVIPLCVAGAMEGRAWLALDSTGQLAHPEFIESLQMVKGMWSHRILGGTLFAVGLALMCANYFMTWVTKTSVSEIPESSVAAADPPREPTKPSALDGAPVLGLALGLERASKLDWHASWERSASKMVWLVVAAIGLASFVQLVPVIWVRGNVPPIASVQPYTPLELAGREIYLTEGCYSCHSQTVRPLVAETKRYGEYSQPGEFVYDRPAFWGSRRIGPDLAREGEKNSSWWHWQHLQNPQNKLAGHEDSVMPSYEYLFHERLDFDQISERVHAMHRRGVPYERELEESSQMSKIQAEKIAAEIVSQGGPVMRGDLMTYDTRGIALIAYLQRLGVDLFAPPPKGKE